MAVVIQSSAPIRYTIVDGMNVRDSRVHRYRLKEPASWKLFNIANVVSQSLQHHPIKQHLLSEAKT